MTKLQFIFFLLTFLSVEIFASRFKGNFVKKEVVVIGFFIQVDSKVTNIGGNRVQTH